MTDTSGGGSNSSDERLAPVIPLFGGARKGPKGSESLAAVEAPSLAADETPEALPPITDAPTTWTQIAKRSETLPRTVDSEPSGTPSERHPARGGAGAPAPKLRVVPQDADTSDSENDVPDPEKVREAGSESLVRKLRTRSLSISEARQVLRGHHLDAGQIDDVIDDFCRRGYLDDVMLANQLVESGTQRKGQGRVALSRALAQRGIPRDVADAALDELPDDDAERALDFARTKARSLSRLDGDTALRRLMGQLARRGYGGSVAMTAAKTALAEVTFGGGRPTGVRFVDSD
ncbi:regulatory protein RecX [Microbacterium oxydans]|uniref:Regulatory protein RecX n=1 Tax=Microbacterium oxydans TaxID=82380 RepID=A0A0F0L7B9_9MICO|nr:regulatory protein RecX [Microbacterium oxydans]KJL28175.1 Regulatory protein RecX [Microbacterium oxydans]